MNKGINSLEIVTFKMQIGLNLEKVEYEMKYID